MATRFFLLGLVLVFFSFGCGEDDPCDEALPSIETYIEQNQLQVQEGEQGLKYIIVEPGGTERPIGDARVTVNYEGRLTNDIVFETTNGTPAEFTLNRLIQGWQLGIPLVGEGGRVTLFLPSNIAYGNSRVGSICPNSDLIFEIELVSFVN